MPADRKRLHVWISGRVQGVGYRAYTHHGAQAHGLTGWVRNLPDGRVEALFDGPEERVDAMLKWCWEGPAFSSVDGIESIEEELVVDAPTSFEIRY